jgi:uncharacterized repeat protein (TIGR01451 family)
MKRLLFAAILISDLAFAEGTPTITLSKSISPEGSQTSGTELTYTIVYENIGDGTATGCVIYDAISKNCEYVAGSAEVLSGSATIWYSADGGSNWTEQDLGTATTNIKWELFEDVAPNGTGSVRFCVRIK